MSSASRPRPGLSRESLDLLLAALDPVRERAGERYEGIRARLLRFFLSRGAPQPEDLADETIDRVCRRLGEGEVIRAPDVARYFLGVARNVAREAWARESRRESGVPLETVLRRAAAAEHRPDEDAMACMESCLEAMPPETRDVLLRYYDAASPEKAQHRRALADSLGIQPNALRIRLHRLRGSLQGCVRRCLQKRSEMGPRSGPLSG
jgi:DNA-directed RNA polymerase specialized sigma24 family protein